MLESEDLKYFGVYFDNTLIVLALQNFKVTEIRMLLKEETDRKTRPAPRAAQNPEKNTSPQFFLPLSDLKLLKTNYFS